MDHGVCDGCEALGQGLLRVYELALQQRELGVAEHVLCALEELARLNPTCQADLDRAYLRIDFARHVNA